MSAIHIPERTRDRINNWSCRVMLKKKVKSIILNKDRTDNIPDLIQLECTSDVASMCFSHCLLSHICKDVHYTSNVLTNRINVMALKAEKLLPSVIFLKTKSVCCPRQWYFTLLSAPFRTYLCHVYATHWGREKWRQTHCLLSTFLSPVSEIILFNSSG